jgi:hypothetical protein
MPTKKKSGGTSLRNVVTAAAGTDGILELVERLGIIDLVLGRMKSRLEETDIDELFDEAKEYLKRNPEVLVVSLGALTVATGVLVFLNARREWDGTERRTTGAGYTAPRPTRVSTGRVRRTTEAD